MLHQDEWSMSITPLEFPLLSVLFRNFLIHGMTSLLMIHEPPSIHSCIPLSFEVQIQNHLLHFVLKTQGYHPNAFQDTSRTPRPSTTETNTCCPSARTLDPSQIKANLGCCSRCTVACIVLSCVVLLSSLFIVTHQTQVGDCISRHDAIPLLLLLCQLTSGTSPHN